MSAKLVIDMNLSVEWVAELAQHGWSAIHWSTVGDERAEDSAIMGHWPMVTSFSLTTSILEPCWP
jgi:predicted nuclease of predicted toxin-antitoxin system